MRRSKRIQGQRLGGESFLGAVSFFLAFQSKFSRRLFFAGFIFEEFRFILICSFVGLDVSEAGVGVVLVICESFAVIDEVLDIIDGYCEAESAEEDVSHICYTEDLSSEVE